MRADTVSQVVAGFVKPMLASGYKPEALRTGEWIAEEKFDGHRLVTRVSGSDVRAWSRDETPRILPPRIRTELAQLADGVYDGELCVPGSRSYGVTELVNVDKLIYVVFDLMEVAGYDATTATWSERRSLLEALHQRMTESVQLSRVEARGKNLTNTDVTTAAKILWDRGGEGLILKRTDAIYQPGKRSREWMKIKQLQSASMVVVALLPGLNGPCSVVHLRDDEGFETTVKTLNRKELANLEKNPEASIGRRLWIEYQERTPDGCYRHPRWDRWEDE